MHNTFSLTEQCLSRLSGDFITQIGVIIIKRIGIVNSLEKGLTQVNTLR